MNATEILRETVESDSYVQRLLLPMALSIAIGSNRQEVIANNEDEMRELLSMVADLVEQRILSIASISQEMIDSDNACDIDKLKDMLLDKCRLLSDLDAAICDRLGLHSTSFGFLCGDRRYRMWSCDNPWYEELLRDLPSWLYDVAGHAMKLEATIRGTQPDVGTGYVTNIDYLSTEIVPEDLDGREELFGNYSKAGIPPFIVRYCDYREFVVRALSDRFGGYDASNVVHVKWRNRFTSVAIPFECDIEGAIETCIILPYSYAEVWYRPYDSLEKRWILDAPYLSDIGMERLIEIAKRDQWERPSFPEIAEKGSLW